MEFFLHEVDSQITNNDKCRKRLAEPVRMMIIRRRTSKDERKKQN